MASDPIDALAIRIGEAFPTPESHPTITLRAGNALDDYESPPPFDPELDRVTGTYIETYYHGIHFLDPESWHYYLPALLLHGLSEMSAGTSSAVDTLRFSLRPSDLVPARFVTLSAEQRGVVVAFLELLGFSPASRYQDDALIALEEYWLANEGA